MTGDGGICFPNGYESGSIPPDVMAMNQARDGRLHSRMYGRSDR